MMGVVLVEYGLWDWMGSIDTKEWRRIWSYVLREYIR